jgi:hypothetical protein
MKQGRRGCGRNKASRGRENLEAQHSRVRQARCRSLSTSASAVGWKNLMEGPSAFAMSWRMKSGFSGHGYSTQDNEPLGRWAGSRTEESGVRSRWIVRVVVAPAKAGGTTTFRRLRRACGTSQGGGRARRPTGRARPTGEVPPSGPGSGCGQARLVTPGTRSVPRR